MLCVNAIDLSHIDRSKNTVFLSFTNKKYAYACREHIIHQFEKLDSMRLFFRFKSQISFSCWPITLWSYARRQQSSNIYSHLIHVSAYISEWWMDALTEQYKGENKIWLWTVGPCNSCITCCTEDKNKYYKLI